MRQDENRLEFEIEARDGAARAGVIQTAHGPIETPAFIPLATKGTVRGLESAEVADLGYQLILGNTYHLFVSPGPERIAAAGGLHGFMNWERAIITDSGGFQVFSLAHGGVANEVKGSGRSGDHGSRVEISEEGARFNSPRDGAELFISPEVSMSVQAALGSDIALVFDECTPFHADYEYTARSTERTHRWLDRCLAWHGENGPERQAVFGIVQGGTHEDLRRESAAAVSAAAVDGIAIGGTLGRDKEEMACSAASPSASTSSTARCRPASPATGSPWPPRPRPAGASTCARAAGSATANRWSRAAPARPANATTATTSATSPEPRSSPPCA
jgi:queuine tRNA-ribosyltransferase